MFGRRCRRCRRFPLTLTLSTLSGVTGCCQGGGLIRSNLSDHNFQLGGGQGRSPGSDCYFWVSFFLSPHHRSNEFLCCCFFLLFFNTKGQKKRKDAIPIWRTHTFWETPQKFVTVFRSPAMGPGLAESIPGRRQPPLPQKNLARGREGVSSPLVVPLSLASASPKYYPPHLPNRYTIAGAAWTTFFFITISLLEVFTISQRNIGKIKSCIVFRQLASGIWR